MTQNAEGQFYNHTKLCSNTNTSMILRTFTVVVLFLIPLFLMKPSGEKTLNRTWSARLQR